MTQDLQRRVDALEAREKARREQLRCIAHDLASPLTPMKLQLSIWKERGMDEAGMRLLERSIDRMARLVEDVADLASHEGEGLRMDVAATELEGVIDAVSQSFMMQASAQGIRFSRSVQDGLLARADAVRVAQVLDNLLRNALKFTPAGGSVSVEAHRVEGAVRIAVADTGRGMSGSERGRLFRPYSQLRSGDSEHGTGLGLFICKNIVQAHGGRLWVESEGHDKGSRFVMELPALSQPLPRPMRRQELLAPSTRRRPEA